MDNQLRILVVEDNPVLASTVRELLIVADPERKSSVRIVESIGEANEAIARGEVDAVLLDLLLPDAADLEGLKRLRSAWPYLPIVVVTGLSSLEEEAFKAGACDFFVKPLLSGRDLLTSLKKSYNRRKTWREFSPCYEGLNRTSAAIAEARQLQAGAPK